MKIPESISSMVYELPAQWQWVWTAGVWMLAVVGIYAMTATTTALALAFWSNAALVMVGACPLVADGKNVFHNVCGVLAAVCSQAWCCVAGEWEAVLMGWCCYALLLPLWGRRWCLVAELLCITLIIMTRCGL